MKAQAIVAVVVASVLLVAATSSHAEVVESSDPRMAPNFTLPSLAQVSLEDVLGSRAAVVWFSFCPCSAPRAGPAAALFSTR